MSAPTDREQLRALVAELVADELAAQGADTFTPDVGQHVDAAGVVTYDFAGHVHAAGLDLDARAGTGPLVPATDKSSMVQWIRQSDGALIAFMAADANGNATVSVEPPDANLYGNLRLFGGPESSSSAMVQVADDASAANSGVYVYGGAPDFTRSKVIDGNGDSDFLRKLDPDVIYDGTPYFGTDLSFSTQTGGRRLCLWWITGYAQAAGFYEVALVVDGVNTAPIGFYFNNTFTHHFMGVGAFIKDFGAGGSAHAWRTIQTAGGVFSADGNDSQTLIVI